MDTAIDHTGPDCGVFFAVISGGLGPQHSLMVLAAHGTQGETTLFERSWRVAHHEYLVDAAVLVQRGLGDLGDHHRRATPAEQVRREVRWLLRSASRLTEQGWMPPALGAHGALSVFPSLRMAKIVDHHDPAQSAGEWDTARMGEELRRSGRTHNKPQAWGQGLQLLAEMLKVHLGEPTWEPGDAAERAALNEARLCAAVWRAGRQQLDERRTSLQLP